MKITDVISTGSVFQKSNPTRKEETSNKESAKSDKANISSKARELANSQNLSTQRRAQIEHRLSTGFYEKEDVLKQVADEILKDPEFKEALKNE